MSVNSMFASLSSVLMFVVSLSGRKSVHTNLTSVLGLCLVLITSSLQGQMIYRKVGISLPSDYSQTDVIQAAKRALPNLNQVGVSLAVDYQKHSPGGTYIQFNQTYRGIPIWQAKVKLTITPAGKVITIMDGTCQIPLNQGSLKFSLTAEQAKQSLDPVAEVLGMNIETYINLHEGKLKPVYCIERFTMWAPYGEGYIIDAQSGKILTSYPLAAFLHHAPQAKDTIGKGHVFIPDPCTAGEVSYGVDFEDNDDADDPAFYPLLDTVQLRDITYRDGVFYLEGPYVQIVDLAQFFIEPATSTDGKFFFNRSQSGFEDVMVYYHIDTFRRYVDHLGFKDLYNEPIKADPHGLGNQDNSVFTGQPGNFTLRFGDGAIDDAEDADIIIHEYGHALNLAASPGSGFGFERSGLDEGISDYLAASYSANISGWQADRLFNWDGNVSWDGRPAITSERKEATGSYTIYQLGTFWCSSLMNIRQQVGSEIVDRLQLQSLYGNVSNISLADAALVFLDADSLLYEGVHTDIILAAFCATGILPDQLQCNAVSIEPSLSPQLRPRVYADPSLQQLTIQWEEGHFLPGDQLSILSLAGQQIHTFQVSALQGELILPLSLPKGLYLLQIQHGQRPQTSQLFHWRP